MITGIGRRRARLVRAPQRDPSSSLLGFSPKRPPHIDQVGVDKVTVSVTGRWQSHFSNGWPLFENSLYIPDADWFNRPARTANPNSTSRTVTLSSRRNTERQGAANRSTLGACKIEAKRLNLRSGPVQIDFTLNPTRTLRHLLARAADPDDDCVRQDQDFISVLRALPVVEFFARANEYSIERSLDGNDNWLPPTRYVRQRVGANFWGSFLPVFFEQVRALSLTLLSEYVVSPQSEGPLDTVALPGGVIAVDWSEVKVPTIECYFERYHRDAVGAVRRGGWALLAADHSAEIATYPDQASFTRDNDRFALGLPLSDVYDLAIYAKRRDRIRFEVRRKKRGRYLDLPRPITALMRLLGIVELERENLLSAVRWDDLGELLEGPDQAGLHDLRDMIDLIHSVVGDDAAELTLVLKALLTEGSVSEAEVGNRVIRRLVDRRVLQPLRIRRRDLNDRVTRYALVAPYRDIHRLLADPLR